MVKDTATKIKDALYEILQTKRIDETNASEICEKANVARRTFYVHFKDKFDVGDSIFKDLFEKYLYKSPSSFSECSLLLDDLINEEHNRNFIKNTICFVGQNSLENSFAEHIQLVLFQILDENGWKKEDDPYQLCSFACCEFSHVITRLLFISLSDFTYEDMTETPKTNTTPLSDMEMIKALVPNVLMQYFF